GFLSADYGLRLNNLGSISQNLTNFVPCSCGSPNNTQIFVLLGDYEVFTNNSNLRVISNLASSINIPVQGHIFNYAAVGSSSMVQQSFLKLISKKNGGDCGNVSLFGTYYSCLNNTTCPTVPSVYAGPDVNLGSSCGFSNSVFIGSWSNNSTFNFQWTCDQNWGLQGVQNPNAFWTKLYYPSSTPPSGGAAQYTLTATTSGGCTGSDVLTARFLTCRLAGEDSSDVSDEEVSIYPNPASNILNIDFNKMPEPNSFLEIEDNLGRKVLKVKLNSDYKQSINIGSLATGVYYIKYTEINKVVVKKLYIIKE
ncbi:MAG: T9SS type A sorting domain-containing protein, partial [Bacteroidia bacterium]|nr:T9SS type A sorting domain-containing protein [Bacteroidia bacterium]